MLLKMSIRLAIVILIAIAATALAGFLLAQRAPIEETNAVTIDITAKQWEYEPKEIRVKEGQTIILKMKSVDVPHGFAIEEYRVNVFLPPGEVMEVKFTADKAGEFLYFCNVFCGTGHPNHKGKLIVESNP